MAALDQSKPGPDEEKPLSNEPPSCRIIELTDLVSLRLKDALVRFRCRDPYFFEYHLWERRCYDEAILNVYGEGKLIRPADPPDVRARLLPPVESPALIPTAGQRADDLSHRLLLWKYLQQKLEKRKGISPEALEAKREKIRQLILALPGDFDPPVKRPNGPITPPPRDPSEPYDLLKEGLACYERYSEEREEMEKLMTSPLKRHSFRALYCLYSREELLEMEREGCVDAEEALLAFLKAPRESAMDHEKAWAHCLAEAVQGEPWHPPIYTVDSLPDNPVVHFPKIPRWEPPANGIQLPSEEELENCPELKPEYMKIIECPNGEVPDHLLPESRRKDSPWMREQEELIAKLNAPKRSERTSSSATAAPDPSNHTSPPDAGTPCKAPIPAAPPGKKQPPSSFTLQRRPGGSFVLRFGKTAASGDGRLAEQPSVIEFRLSIKGRTSDLDTVEKNIRDQLSRIPPPAPGRLPRSFMSWLAGQRTLEICRLQNYVFGAGIIELRLSKGATLENIRFSANSVTRLKGSSASLCNVQGTGALLDVQLKDLNCRALRLDDNSVLCAPHLQSACFDKRCRMSCKATEADLSKAVFESENPDTDFKNLLLRRKFTPAAWLNTVKLYHVSEAALEAVNKRLDKVLTREKFVELAAAAAPQKLSSGKTVLPPGKNHPAETVEYRLEIPGPRGLYRHILSLSSDPESLPCKLYTLDLARPNLSRNLWNDPHHPVHHHDAMAMLLDWVFAGRPDWWRRSIRRGYDDESGELLQVSGTESEPDHDSAESETVSIPRRGFWKRVWRRTKPAVR